MIHYLLQCEDPGQWRPADPEMLKRRKVKARRAGEAPAVETSLPAAPDVDAGATATAAAPSSNPFSGISIAAPTAASCNPFSGISLLAPAVSIFPTPRFRRERSPKTLEV